MAEYATGDHAIGASGENTVNRTYVNEFDGEMVRIKAVGMLPIEVTPEHPMLVSRSRIASPCATRNGRHSRTIKIALGSPMWKPASQLLAKRSSADGDYVLIPRLLGSVDVKELDLSSFAKNGRGLNVMIGKGHTPSVPLNAETAWSLGLYAAGGYASQGKLKFALNSDEVRLRDRLTHLFEALGYKVRTYRQKSENGIEVVVFGEVLSRAFESWCGRGAPNKRVPDFVLLHTDPSITDSFLEGCVSGDGTTTSNCMGKKNVIHIVTTSGLLAMQVQLLGARKGLFFRITRASKAGNVQGRSVRIHPKYDVRCSLSDSNQTRVDDKFIYAPIRRIENIGYSGPVYNLGTTDHTYLISNAISHNCDALLIDEKSTTATYPYMEIQEDDATVTHEASVGKVGEEQLFYLTSRGITDNDALSMVVNGFMEPFTRELPMVYAVEFNRLMSLEMTNTVG
ncbi:MAG: SufD family Fe-S cluster assembly protein [Nitrososphaerota archaeon]|nr:SufD family Fe-S cluster assembly protein [Nitrososphaerota archaeon]